MREMEIIRAMHDIRGAEAGEVASIFIHTRISTYIHLMRHFLIGRKLIWRNFSYMRTFIKKFNQIWIFILYDEREREEQEVVGYLFMSRCVSSRLPHLPHLASSGRRKNLRFVFISSSLLLSIYKPSVVFLSIAAKIFDRRCFVEEEEVPLPQVLILYTLLCFSPPTGALYVRGAISNQIRSFF